MQSRNTGGGDSSIDSMSLKPRDEGLRRLHMICSNTPLLDLCRGWPYRYICVYTDPQGGGRLYQRCDHECHCLDQDDKPWHPPFLPLNPWSPPIPPGAKAETKTEPETGVEGDADKEAGGRTFHLTDPADLTGLVTSGLPPWVPISPWALASKTDPYGDKGKKQGGLNQQNGKGPTVIEARSDPEYPEDFERSEVRAAASRAEMEAKE